jgi:hypothetical protein
MKYDHVDKEFTKEPISGIDFYKMNAMINYSGMSINQLYYSAVLKDFSFNIIISYVNDEQKESLLKTIGTMTFEK